MGGINFEGSRQSFDLQNESRSMTRKKITVDVLCVGHASYDLTFSISHHPSPDEKTTASSFLGCGGGPATNAAVAVSRLGYRAAFGGYLGDDYYGDLHFQELQVEGVLTDLILRGSFPTPLSVILVKPDGRRSLVNYHEEVEQLPSDWVQLSDIETKVILFDGHEPQLSAALAESAKGTGIKTILDAGSVHLGTQQLASEVDFLVCSEKFARGYTGENDLEHAVNKLAGYAPSVVVTLGGEGLIWKNEQGAGRVPAFKVDVHDTTGAGDTFHGAFAACLAANKGWGYSLRYGSAAAALSCTKMGARSSIPTKLEVSEYLEGISPE
jgi:sulfofructose kinase